MNVIKITAFLLMISPLVIQAQQGESNETVTKSRQLGLGFGFQNRHLVDEQKSALVYVSKEYNAELFYKKEKNQYIFSTSLNLGQGSYIAKYFRGRYWYSIDYNIDGTQIKDSVPVVSGILAGQLQIAYERKFAVTGHFSWYAGGTLEDLLVYPDNNIGLLNSLSLNASLHVAYNLTELHRFGARLAVPLVAANSRLPWHNTASDPVKSETSVFFKKGTRLVTLNNYQSIQLNVNYAFHLSRRFTLGAEYQFTWLRIPYYQPMKSYVNRIQIFTAYIF